MNVKVFSHDRYFSCGLMQTLQSEGIKCETFHLDDLNAFSISAVSGFHDLVVLDISMLKNLNYLFMTGSMLSNILFVVDIRPEFLEENRRIVSKVISADDLVDIIKRFMDIKTPKIKDVEFETLRLINAGEDMSSISSRLNITGKSVYRLRHNSVRKFGFARYHPLTAVYCGRISSFL